MNFTDSGIISISTILEPFFKRLLKRTNINVNSGGYKLFQKLRTFIIFAVSRIVSIPGTLAASWAIFSSVFRKFGPWKLVDGSLYELGIGQPQFIVTLLAIALVGYVSSRQERGIKIREWIAARPLPIRWFLYYMLIFAVLIFGTYGPGYDAASFAYMKY